MTICHSSILNFRYLHSVLFGFVFCKSLKKILLEKTVCSSLKILETPRIWKLVVVGHLKILFASFVFFLRFTKLWVNQLFLKLLIISIFKKISCTLGSKMEVFLPFAFFNSIQSFFINFFVSFKVCFAISNIA